MKLIPIIVVLTATCGVPAMAAQNGQENKPETPAQAQRGTSERPPLSEPQQAELYNDFMQGHLLEQQFEATGQYDLADRSIAAYKKALALAPDSSVARERLAEIEAQSQHIKDAVLDAREALALDSNNVDAHRLLARIYIRSLGDMSEGEVQKKSIDEAIEQFQDILSLQPNDSYSALWLARLYRFENEHDKAEKTLRSVLQHEPDNDQALEQLSQLLTDEGRTQEAVSLLSQAAADSPSPDIYDLLGTAYTQQKDWAKAEEAYEQAIAQDPDEANYHQGLAEALLEQGKYPEALAQYKKLSELQPGTAENYVRMAELYRRLGKFDDAKTSILRAKELAPGNLQVLYNEALLYEDQGNYDQAIQVLTDAIAGMKAQSSTNPGGATALAILYEKLGQVYEEAQNYPEAIETYQQMAKLSPNQEKRAQLLLIDAYQKNREIDRAIAETRKALIQWPRDPELTVNLAMLYGEKTDAPDATKLLQGMLRGNASDQQIYVDLAQVQERSKKYDDAEKSAQKAEEMATAPADKQMAWFMLGAIYERQKKYDLAEQEFQKVLQQNPNNAPVLNYYGYMLADRGVRLDEATSLIQKAVKQEPNNGAYLDSLGWAYYKQDKLAEAQEYLHKAVDRDSDDPTILSHLGDVYIKLGENQQAADTLERALSEWQKAVPADYDPQQINKVDAQLRSLKKRLAQKTSPETAKPQ
ncbi:MAG TPA: tetratricopeptide repeat protein [Candidatus Acidoferrum sp.]|nr:tetratricopeptide repeat protein [Candidatus Acidoferrum sp.]